MVAACLLLVVLGLFVCSLVDPQHVEEWVLASLVGACVAPVVGAYLGLFVRFGQKLAFEYSVVNAVQFRIEIVLTSVIIVLVQIGWAGVWLAIVNGDVGSSFLGVFFCGGVIAVACGICQMKWLAVRGFVVEGSRADIQCGVCGYDLRGGPAERCPECGSPTCPRSSSPGHGHSASSRHGKSEET